MSMCAMTLRAVMRRILLRGADASRSWSVERCGQSPARLTRERIARSEPVELADDQAPHVVVGKGGEQQLERTLALARVERSERLGERALLGEADPRAQALSLEVVGERREHGVGLLELAAGDQQTRERDRGVGARGL